MMSRDRRQWRWGYRVYAGLHPGETQVWYEHAEGAYLVDRFDTFEELFFQHEWIDADARETIPTLEPGESISV